MAEKKIGHDCKKGKHAKCNWRECECDCHLGYKGM